MAPGAAFHEKLTGRFCGWQFTDATKLIGGGGGVGVLVGVADGVDVGVADAPGNGVAVG